MSSEIVHVRGRVLRTTFGRIDIEVDERTVAIDVSDDLSTSMALVASDGVIERQIGRDIEVWGTIVDTQQLASAGYRDAGASVPSSIHARATAFAPRPVHVVSAARASVLIALAILATLSVGLDVQSMVRSVAMYGLALALHALHAQVLPPRPSTNDVRSMGVLFVHVALWGMFYAANLDGAPAWIGALPAAAFIAWGVLAFATRSDQLPRLLAVRTAPYGAVCDDDREGVTALFGDHERRIAKSDVTLISSDPTRSHTRALIGESTIYTSDDDPRSDLARRIPWLRITTIVGPLALIALGFVMLARL